MLSPVPRCDWKLEQTGGRGGGTGRAGNSTGSQEHLQVLWLAWPALRIIAIHKHERVKHSHPPSAAI